MLGSFIATIAAGETANIVNRAKRAAIAYAVAGILLVLAGIFGLIAAYVWAAVRYGPINAAGGFAIAFAVLAVVVVVVHRVTSRAQAKRAAQRRSLDMRAIAATAAVAAAPALITRGPSVATLAVPVLGVLGYLIYQENMGPRRAPASPRRRRPV